MLVKKLNLNQVEVKKDLYPRAISDWQTTYKYTQVLLTGGNFPPICVNEIKGKYILVDGLHRLTAHKKVKRRIIEAEVLKNLSDKEMFVEAIRRNTTHGLSLTPYDLARAIERLKKYKIEKVVIAKITHVPVEKLEKFVAKRMTKLYTGERFFLRKPLQHLAETSGQDLNLLEIDTIDSGVEQNYSLRNLINMLKTKTLNIDNKKTRALLEELYEILKDVFS